MNFFLNTLETVMCVSCRPVQHPKYRGGPCWEQSLSQMFLLVQESTLQHLKICQGDRATDWSLLPCHCWKQAKEGSENLSKWGQEALDWGKRSYIWTFWICFMFDFIIYSTLTMPFLVSKWHLRCLSSDVLVHRMLRYVVDCSFSRHKFHFEVPLNTPVSSCHYLALCTMESSNPQHNWHQRKRTSLFGTWCLEICQMSVGSSSVGRNRREIWKFSGKKPSVKHYFASVINWMGSLEKIWLSLGTDLGSLGFQITFLCFAASP